MTGQVLHPNGGEIINGRRLRLTFTHFYKRHRLASPLRRVLFEHDNPMLLAEHARAALRRCKASLVARVAVAWTALREAVEEKTEVMMAEPIEILTHIAPQLVALA